MYLYVGNSQRWNLHKKYRCSSQFFYDYWRRYWIRWHKYMEKWWRKFRQLYHRSDAFIIFFLGRSDNRNIRCWRCFPRNWGGYHKWSDQHVAISSHSQWLYNINNALVVLLFPVSLRRLARLLPIRTRWPSQTELQRRKMAKKFRSGI